MAERIEKNYETWKTVGNIRKNKNAFKNSWKNKQSLYVLFIIRDVLKKLIDEQILQQTKHLTTSKFYQIFSIIY